MVWTRSSKQRWSPSTAWKGEDGLKGSMAVKMSPGYDIFFVGMLLEMVIPQTDFVTYYFEYKKVSGVCKAIKEKVDAFTLSGHFSGVFGLFKRQIAHIRKVYEESGSCLQWTQDYARLHFGHHFIPLTIKMKRSAVPVGLLAAMKEPVRDALWVLMASDAASGLQYRHKRVAIYKIVDEYCLSAGLGVRCLEVCMDIFDRVIELVVVERSQIGGSHASNGQEMWTTIRELLGYMFASVVVASKLVSGSEMSIPDVVRNLDVGTTVFTVKEINIFVIALLEKLQWKLPSYCYTDAFAEVASLSSIMAMDLSASHRVEVMVIARLLIDEWNLMAQWMKTSVDSSDEGKFYTEKLQTLGCGKLTVAAAALYMSVCMRETEMHFNYINRPLDPVSDAMHEDEPTNEITSLELKDRLLVVRAELQAICGGRPFQDIINIMFTSWNGCPPFQRCTYLRKCNATYFFRYRLQDDKHSPGSKLVRHGSCAEYDEYIANTLA